MRELRVGCRYQEYRGSAGEVDRMDGDKIALHANGASGDTEITLLLVEWRNGNAQAMERLFGLIYAELHRMARGQRRRAWSVETLNTTALVHEAYLKLVDQSTPSWQDRAHFLAVASTAMRHIVINYAERKRTHKRGGDWREITFSEAAGMIDDRVESLLAIQQALVYLDELDPRLVQIVDCRFFGGLTETEIAGALGVTERTVRREWRKARAVLASALSSVNATQSNHLAAAVGQHP